MNPERGSFFMPKFKKALYIGKLKPTHRVGREF